MAHLFPLFFHCKPSDNQVLFNQALPGRGMFRAKALRGSGKFSRQVDGSGVHSAVSN